MSDQSFLKPNAFGGFNKQSVLAYISELDEQVEYARDQAKAKDEEINGMRAQLSLGLSQAQERIDKLQRDVQTANAQLAENRKLAEEQGVIILSLTAEIDRQKDIVLEKNGQISRMQAHTVEIETRSSELESRSGEVEAASVQIGRMLLEARSSADKIVNEAEDQARQTRDTADRTATATREKAESVAEKILDGTKREAGDIAREAIDAISQVHSGFSLVHAEITSIRAAFEQAMDAAGRKLDAVEAHIDSAKERFSDDKLLQRQAQIQAMSESYEATSSENDAVEGDGDFFFPAVEN